MTGWKLLKLTNKKYLTAIEAVRLLQCCRLGRFNALCWLGAMEPDQLHAVERIYLSHWLCRFKIVVERGLSVLETSEIDALVNGLTFTTSWLLERPLIERVGSEAMMSFPSYDIPLSEEAMGDSPAVTCGGIVKPRKNAEQALAVARTGLKWNVVKGRLGKFRGHQVQSEQATLIFLPMWLGYYRSVSGKVRVKILNGSEGTIEEHQVTMAVLEALGDRVQSIGNAFIP